MPNSKNPTSNLRVIHELPYRRDGIKPDSNNPDTSNKSDDVNIPDVSKNPDLPNKPDNSNKPDVSSKMPESPNKPDNSNKPDVSSKKPDSPNKPDNSNKPDVSCKKPNSPVSPLRVRFNLDPAQSGQTASTTTGTTATTSSSSSSSGSVSGRTTATPAAKGHAGEKPGSASGSSPKTAKPSHGRSSTHGATVGAQTATASGSGGAVNSPSVNVLPAGNICPSGKIPPSGIVNRQPPRTDVVGSGTGNYGHGSIMRGTSTGSAGGSRSVGVSSSSDYCSADPMVRRAMASLDPEEVKRVGNEQYKKGNFSDALNLYDRAIAMSPLNATYWSNRAAALTGLGRLVEAVTDCEEAVRLDRDYIRAHHRLAGLLIRMGQVEAARKHLFFDGQLEVASEVSKLHTVEKHLTRCTDKRRNGDWKNALKECEAAIAAGADSSPQLFCCRAECLLKLRQLEDAASSLSNISLIEQFPQSCSGSKIFGMLSEAYPYYVRAQIEMAGGRFEDALTCAEKAAQIDPRTIEITTLLNNVRYVARARSRGNDLFRSERYTEACGAYGDGIRVDPGNPVLCCNRAACWYKLGNWEKSIEDCNRALKVLPNYSKALLRRAASSSKLERWADAARDYEALKRENPHDTEVAESLFHAQVALRKSRGEEVQNMSFGGEVEKISGSEEFKTAILMPGISVVLFKIAPDPECIAVSSFLEVLCVRYGDVRFFEVDVEKSPAIANAECVKYVPTIKIYRNGGRVKEIVDPTNDALEAAVRHYSLSCSSDSLFFTV